MLLSGQWLDQWDRRVRRAQAVIDRLHALEKTKAELAATDARLANEEFINNAPAKIVEGARARQAELRARLEKLGQNQ